MTIRQYQSPTGALIVGTLERLTGRAEIQGINSETGEPEYSGETEIFYDDQRTETRGAAAWPKNLVYLDENGQEWTFDELIEDSVDCPQCNREGDFCLYCNDAGSVTQSSAEEWHRQND